MAEISTEKRYQIIKSCGDNVPGYEEEVEPGKWVDPHYGIDIHHFLVEPATSYSTRKAAEKRARELAEATPENRYYVVRSVVGFMGETPKVQRKFLGGK